jgi:hypothetical protein
MFIFYVVMMCDTTYMVDEIFCYWLWFEIIQVLVPYVITSYVIH